ncbi:MAG TPA: HDIG domain-containing protein [Anaerolineae bacterium]|nr:HDIG domain-containing protein [Anaerolineae bacterium]
MTQDVLLTLIPEFNLIQNADLRAKTLQTWELAMQEGGWTLESLQRMPFTLLINPCPVNFVEHTRAVAQIAIKAAEVFAAIYGDRVPVDRDVLISGGILRDVGKLVEYEEREPGVFVQTPAGKLLRHPFTGVELAARCGLPVTVQHIIAAHAEEGDKVKRTTEATIVNHADFISFHAILRLAPGKSLEARIG